MKWHYDRLVWVIRRHLKHAEVIECQTLYSGQVHQWAKTEVGLDLVYTGVKSVEKFGLH